MAAKEDATRIKKRPEYLAVAATGRKWVTPGFILQAKPGEETAPARVGYTVSKKAGGAVIRSKIKRRLKEASRQQIAEHGMPGWDYVLIGRSAAFDCPFDKLLSDMKWALAKLASGADLKGNSAPKKKRQHRKNG